MRVFWNRPLCLAGCITAVAMLCTAQMKGTYKLLLLLTAVAFLCFLIGYAILSHGFTKATETAFWCCLALLLAMLSSFCFYDVRMRGLETDTEGECLAEGVVLSVESKHSYESELCVRVDTLNGTRLRTKAILHCTYASSLQAGDRFCATVVARRSEETGELSRSYLFSDGYLLELTSVSSDQMRRTERDMGDIDVLLRRLNTSLSYLLKERIGGEAGALSAALLLGNRSFLSEGTELNFRRAGISHLLALSGLHVSVLIGALEGILRKCRIPKRVRVIPVLLCAVGYLLLSGCSPSTLRAVALVSVSYLGFLLGESYDSLTALSVTLAVMLVLMPYAIHDLSLWMSFLAAAGIIIFTPALTERWKIKGKLKKPSFYVRLWRSFLGALSVGVWANLGILLLTAYAFGEISLLSVPATMLLSFPVEGLLILSALSLLFPGNGLHALTALLGKGVLSASAALSDGKGVLVSVEYPGMPPLLGIATLLLVLFAVLHLKHKKWLLLVPTVAVIALLLPSVYHVQEKREGVCVDYVCTESGSTVLFYEGGSAVAIDCTDGAPENAALLLGLLKECRATELEALVLPHTENVSGYQLSILASRIKIRRLVLSGSELLHQRAIESKLAEEAATCGIEVSYAGDGCKLGMLSVETVFHQEQGYGKEGVVFSALCRDMHLIYVDGEMAWNLLPKSVCDTVASADILVLGKDFQGEDFSVLPVSFSSPPAYLFLAKEETESVVPWYPLSRHRLFGVGSYRFSLK